MSSDAGRRDNLKCALVARSFDMVLTHSVVLYDWRAFVGGQVQTDTIATSLLTQFSLSLVPSDGTFVRRRGGMYGCRSANDRHRH
jgi:hypothetical protein